MATGKVTLVDNELGYGIIDPGNGDLAVRFKFSNYRPRDNSHGAPPRAPQVGDRVVFKKKSAGRDRNPYANPWAYADERDSSVEAGDHAAAR